MNEIWAIRKTVEEYQRQIFAKEISGNFPTYPNSGKTYGILKNTAEHEFDTTLLQPNRDLRDETSEVGSDDFNLSVLDLPSFPNDSPLMDESSQYYDSDVVDWYERGMPPRDIYRRVDGPDNDLYLEKLDDDWSNYDLRVGDPVHAFLDRASIGHNVVFDDINVYESFVTRYSFTDESKSHEIKEYLDYYHHELTALADGTGLDEPIPQSITEVLQASEDMKNIIRDLAEDNPSHRIIPDTRSVRAETSRFLRIITTPRRWQHSVEWVETDPCIKGGIKIIGVNLPEDDCVLIGQIPLNLVESKNVLMLGATPVYPVLKKFFKHLKTPAATIDPLTTEEKEIYFDEYMNMEITQTTDNQHFVSGDNGVKWDKLEARVDMFERMYDETPLVISSKKFLDRVSDKLDERNIDSIHFAKAIGTNEFDDVTGCIIFGCPHYGDQYVRQMAAFCDDFDAEPIRNPGQPTRWSTETSQEIYENMTKGTVFQALMRVGRSTNAKTRVWCETSMIPDYVPSYKLGIEQLTDAEQEIMEAAKQTAEVTDIHDATGYSKTHIYRTLYKLEDLGLIEEQSREMKAATYTAIAKTSKHTDLDIEAGFKEIFTQSYRLVIRSGKSKERKDPDIKERTYVLTLGSGMEPPKIDEQEAEERLDTDKTVPIWDFIDDVREIDPSKLIPGSSEDRYSIRGEQTTLGS